MQNAGQDEAQAEIKIAGRNINNLRYENNTTVMAESEEELKSLLENGEILTKNDKLEKVSFHSNHKQRQCQRMFKHSTILHDSTAQLHSSHTLAK